jgi:hypothetical protein
MITDTTINNYIEQKLLEEDKKKRLEWNSSGKLSASMLYQPLRFQILKTIGVPTKVVDPYVLGKFKRGNDVEEWFIEQLKGKGLVETQKEVKYRHCVGYVDAIVDTRGWQFECGIIPHEVKSVTNAKLRRIKKTGIDWHYKIQATLYALALETEHYAIDIVSAEDLRPTVCIFKTSELKKEVDRIISDYNDAISAWTHDGILPKFEPLEQVKWTGNLKYAIFDEFWATAPDREVNKKLKELDII